MIELDVANFTYERKGNRWTGWWLRSPDDFRGDCEDFALTRLYHAEGCSWWRVVWAILVFRAVFWQCDSHITQDTSMPTHAVLWHREYGWTDSNVGNRHWHSPLKGQTRWVPWGWVAIVMIAWGAIYRRGK